MRSRFSRGHCGWAQGRSVPIVLSHRHVSSLLLNAQGVSVAKIVIIEQLTCIPLFSFLGVFLFVLYWFVNRLTESSQSYIYWSFFYYCYIFQEILNVITNILPSKYVQ